MGDGFTLPAEPVPDDGDMTRLVLQHCVMPAYQFIIQVQPDQPTVINNHQTVFICTVFMVEQQTKTGERKKNTFFLSFQVSHGLVDNFKAVLQQLFEIFCHIRCSYYILLSDAAVIHCFVSFT